MSLWHCLLENDDEICIWVGFESLSVMHFDDYTVKVSLTVNSFFKRLVCILIRKLFRVLELGSV